MACLGVKRVWVPPKVAPALWKQSGLGEGRKTIWTIWQSSCLVQSGLSGDDAPEEQSKMLVALLVMVTIEVMMVRLTLFNCP